jgi:hypothetical protein
MCEELQQHIPTRFVIPLYGIFLIFRSKTLKIEDPVYWDHMLQQGSDFHINAITLYKKILIARGKESIDIFWFFGFIPLQRSTLLL